MLFAVHPVVHVNCTVEDDEHLGAVVHMPHVRLIGPVHPDRRRPDVDEIERTPRTVGGVVGGGVETPEIALLAS